MHGDFDGAHFLVAAEDEVGDMLGDGLDEVEALTFDDALDDFENGRIVDGIFELVALARRMERERERDIDVEVLSLLALFVETAVIGAILSSFSFVFCIFLTS